MNLNDDHILPGQRLASVDLVSKLTSIPVSTLNMLRSKRPAESPPHVKIGGRIYYPLSGEHSLESWIDSKIEAAQKEISDA